MKNNKEKPIFSLTPKNGFYSSDKEMAYLDAFILCYHPHNSSVEDDNGYVYFTFYKDGDTTGQNLRLFVKAVGKKKMRAEFDIETTNPVDTNNFNFCIAKPEGGFENLETQTIEGKQKQILKVKFNTNGNVIIKMYATKNIDDYTPYILRKIQVFPQED
jgi:hypothetical protein